MLRITSPCDYPCEDINKDFIFPRFRGDPGNIKLVMISEAPPCEHRDYFYESSDGSFFETTKTAFGDAGYEINSYDDFSNLGIYLTTAIKCSKIGYLVSSRTIRECSSRYLEEELNCFRNVKGIMCMGDFAIKAVNYIYKKRYGIFPVKRGSTYKIRKEPHILNGIRFFPSYTQTGGSYNIEQSKRKMIAGDIKTAMNLVCV